MSKIITIPEIADLLVQAMNHPEQMPWSSVQGISTDAAYQALLRDLGYRVARHFGGRFNGVAKPDGIEGLGYALSFSWDRQVPVNGGIYTDFDTDIPIQAWKMEKPKLSSLDELI